MLRATNRVRDGAAAIHDVVEQQLTAELSSGEAHSRVCRRTQDGGDKNPEESPCVGRVSVCVAWLWLWLWF